MKKIKMRKKSPALIKTVKKNLPSILAWVSAAGVAVTTGLAVRSTAKSLKKIQKAERRYGRKLTKGEMVKTAAPSFVSTFVVGGVTIACIFTGDRLHIKREMAIGSAYAMISQAYQEYRKEVAKINAGEVDQQALSNIRQKEIEERKIPKPEGDKLLFFEEISGRYFESTMLEVVDAEYHFNRNYWLRGGYSNLNEFYDFLGLDRTPAGDILGWSSYWGEAFYGYTWVDFEHTLTTLDDGLECYIISYPFPPTGDYENDPNDMFA